MEHKLDDYFRKKIELAEDDLPESSGFDENLFWRELQKTVHKPQPKHTWKWVAAVACQAGITVGLFFINRPEAGIPENTIAIQPAAMKPEPAVEPIALQPKLTVAHKTIKKETIEAAKETKPEIEMMAIRLPEPAVSVQIVKQDSIHFQAPAMVETKPKFKTVHVNEISNNEEESIPQPKFKIRFAARNLP